MQYPIIGHSNVPYFTVTPFQMGEAGIDYWPTGQRLLSDIHFLSRIKAFPRDSVPKKTMAIIREFVFSHFLQAILVGGYQAKRLILLKRW